MPTLIENLLEEFHLLSLKPERALCDDLSFLMGTK